MQKFRLTKYFMLTFLALHLMPNKSIAQNYQSTIQQYFEGAKEKNNWQAKDIQEWKITDQYVEPSNGLTHIYVQQTINQIPVWNAISIFLLRGNEMLYSKAGLVDHVNDKVNAYQASITPANAVQLSLQHLGETLTEPLKESTQKTGLHQYQFEANEIASSPIKVCLLYKLIDNKLILAWDVSIEMKEQAHWWNIRIDALTGAYLDKNDYTVECNFNHDDEDLNALSLYNDPPPPPPPPPPVIPSYRAYPYPVEAPTFGSRSLLVDPSSVTASPYGWHDVDGIVGEEYTITRGNNVFAYEDINNDNQPGYSPDGGASLLFDYPYTPGILPTLNQDAALTNLFYTVNAIHDYIYPFGFNEVSGNFQTNNYGNGGANNDHVKAEGFDGSGSNNANFSTPPDGSSGRMQMYLWSGNTTPCTSLSVASNSFTGPMVVSSATFSPIATVTAQIALADDGVGVSSDACTSLITSLTGKIALIDRGGTCNFVAKAQQAASAGAVGVIIANNVSGGAMGMTGISSPPLTIPVVGISLADGNTLKSALLSGVVNATISTCTVHPIDANFDNGVIAHEYGHGLSNRLTGGPSLSSCLTNAEQGGEGWSDWLGLMMTIEPGDQGSDARGIGTFVRGQATNGGGIRRYPYSTNMSVNPQTYADVAGSTTVHQIGEIWCDALWDMSWKLMDAYGISSNPMNASAGNNIAMKLVLEGMKLQPCNPGYIDARDAILTAEAILYNNVHRCLLWQAFAGRGMGFNASQGSAFATGDETASFALPPFCLPATQAPIAAFTSDSISISCGGKINFTDQSSNAFDWLWDFGDQTTSILQNPTHTYTAPGSYAVKLKVTNPLGVDSVIHTITVTPTFTVSVTASPLSICGGSPVNLNAVASGSTNRSYQVSTIPYAPLTGTGTNVTLTDDQMSSSRPIGFTFNFFGVNYTNFYICSNGFITFSAGMPASAVYGEILPTLSNPNNIIALAWNDLNPANAGSNINYFTTGTTPNRKLVVTYNTSHYLSATQPFVIQAILYEGSNEIEIHTTSISDMTTFDASAATTQGVENANGTIGVAVPGRNRSLFAASNDAYRFVPYVPYVYNWQPGTLIGSSTTVNPISIGAYTVNVTDGTACNAPFTSPVINIIPCNLMLNLKAFIEGYYVSGGIMASTMYNEGITIDQNLCDSIVVELRSAATPFNLVASVKPVLNINGTALCNFFISSGNYYIVVKHRNGLETWSANPMQFAGATLNYDFTNAVTKAFGNNMKQVEPNVWAIYAGELNKDENIDLLDQSVLSNSIANFDIGYIATDINGDGNVDLLDMTPMEINVNDFIFSAHP